MAGEKKKKQVSEVFAEAQTLVDQLAPQATMTLKARNFPGGAYLQSNSKVVEKTASVPVEQFTNQVHLRLRGRSFAFRIESTDTGIAWRLGSPRVDVQADGMR